MPVEPVTSAPYVAVVGPGEGATGEESAIAAELGGLLAAAGCVVVTGGLGGVMAAAARGAAAVGGTTVGLLPGTDRSEAVGPLSVIIRTGLGELRNALVVRAADAVVAVGGSWGTATEVALAMRTGVPVVVVGGWRKVDAAGTDVPVPRRETAAEAVAAVLDALGRSDVDAERGRGR